MLHVRLNQVRLLRVALIRFINRNALGDDGFAVAVRDASGNYRAARDRKINVLDVFARFDIDFFARLILISMCFFRDERGRNRRDEEMTRRNIRQSVMTIGIGRRFHRYFTRT